jgi:hypothetical protein
VSTLVFPEPAPAITITAPSVASTASLWEGFNPERKSVTIAIYMERMQRCLIFRGNQG